MVATEAVSAAGAGHGLGLWQALLGTAAALFTAFLLSKVAAKARDVQRMRAVLAGMPGPAPLPLLGNLPELLSSQDEFWPRVVRLMQRHAPTFCFWLGLTPFVVITDPRDYEHVTASAKFNDKSSWYPLARAALGTGLITLSGEQWRRHRRAIAPSLHQHVLVQNVEVFRRKAAELSPMLTRAARSGLTVDILEYCNLVSMDSVCETLLSADLSRHAAALGRFVEQTTAAARLVTHRVCRPWLLCDRLHALTRVGRATARLQAETDAFIDGVVSKRRRQRGRHADEVAGASGAAPKRRSLLEHALACEDEREGLADLMTAEEWREEAKAMVVAGQGTVAHCLSFALLMLAMHPDQQHRLHQELDDVFGADPERVVTEAELPHLQCLERAVLETLRLFPLVPVFGRDCPEDTVLPSGAVVPRGAHLFMFSFHTHRDPAWFPDPLRFDPDRFLPEQVRARPPLSFAAFSAGPRACIGQRYAMMYLKTVLGTVLRRYQVHRPPGDTRTVADLPLEIGVILSMDGGFPVRVSERCAPGEGHVSEALRSEAATT